MLTINKEEIAEVVSESDQDDIPAWVDYCFSGIVVFVLLFTTAMIIAACICYKG